MGKRILVVDDDEDFRILVTKFLEELGHTVETASNVAGARERIAAAGAVSPFEGVVCDVNMPEARGQELLKSLKSGAQEVPIFVFVTAQPDRDTVTGLIGIEADYILCKPITKEGLEIGLEKAEKRRTDRELEKVMREFK